MEEFQKNDDMLQQYLPFTVLKLEFVYVSIHDNILLLQQYLPFTVLKPNGKS